MEHPEKAFGEAALVRKFLPLGKLSNRPTDAPESSEALEPRGTSSLRAYKVSKPRQRRRLWRRPKGRKRRDGVEGSSEKLIFRRGDSRLRTNPLFISPRKAHPSCMPRSNPRLVTTLPQPVSLCARPSFVLARSSSSLFPSLRSSALLRSPPLAATPDCSVSRFAIYSSWRKNERHAARIGLPIFHPCRASRRRISRTRVIIEPRTTTCSEGRAFLLTKLANEI